MVNRILLIFMFMLFALNCFSQKENVRIGILTRNVDTSFTHVYVDMVRTLDKQNPYPFNLLEYYWLHIDQSFPDSNISFSIVEWQTMFNKFNFYNFNGKPGKKCKEWLSSVSQKDSIDYLIFLDAKNVLSSSYYSGIKSNSYGIATFYQNAKMITIYSMVYPRVYSLNPIEEIEIKREQMPYLSNPIILDREDKLSMKEIETLTSEYHNMALDSIKFYTDGQIELISKKLKMEIYK